MNLMKNTDEKLNSSRLNKVIKSNNLIINTISNLSLSEQKLLSFIISKIGRAEKLSTISFELIEYIKICNLDPHSGKNYKLVKKSLENLANIKTWLRFENDERLKEKFFHWITDFELDTDTKKNITIVSVNLNPILENYLTQLKGKFTYYELINILAMKSQYSPRLYEILKSYSFMQEVTYDIDELKLLLNATNYANFAQFNNRVIKVAVAEINLFTDINCSFDIIKSSRKIVGIIFKICSKENKDIMGAYQLTLNSL